MSQDAMMVFEQMLFEQVHKKEIVIRHVPVQEDPATPASTGLSPSDPLSAPLLSRLVTRMQALGDEFTSTINAATTDLIHRIDASIETGAPANSITMTRLKVMTAQNEFLGRILEASTHINSQRLLLIEEIKSLGGQWNGKLLEEIAKTEGSVSAAETTIQQMIDDNSADLSRAMRANASHNELKAYLKGLKFQGGDRD